MKPGSITPHTKFKCKAYILKKGACTLILHTLMLLLGVAGLRGDEDILQNGALWQQVVELEDEADRTGPPSGSLRSCQAIGLFTRDVDEATVGA